MKYKILIVDDEQDNLDLMYRTMRREYDIERASGPLQALDILKNNQDFALIFSDHKMPDMDGVEFLKRASEYVPHAVKILVTAYTDSKILIDAINNAKIYRYIKKPYAPEELLYVAKTCAEYYQLKVDNERLIVDLKELFGGTIKAITEALDAKDQYTAGRSRRVTFYASKLAQKLGFSNSEAGKIELAGLLHDIGMIGVTEEILHKTEQLTPQEFNEIKRHVFHSIKILEDIKQLEGVVEIIKYHHEHYDGTGYPFGLEGEEIPIGSRIIAIADAFDGILSNRAYKQKASLEEAQAELKELAGSQFDPKLIEIFETILPELESGLTEIESSNIFEK
ncbi:HD domain-containing protein [bacterium]|nr:HD domain-containing protein [bacterium]